MLFIRGFMKNQKILPVQDEMLDLVDEHDEVFSSMWRSEVYKKKMFSHIRSVWLMIRNSNNELWILRRSYDRPNLPGCLDGAVAGHVQAGECYEDALKREAFEEIGVHMTVMPYRFLGKLTPQNDNAFCFVQVYESQLDQAPEHWNRAEFCEAFWIKPQDLLEKIEKGEAAKSALSQILKAFYI